MNELLTVFEALAPSTRFSPPLAPEVMVVISAWFYRRGWRQRPKPVAPTQVLTSAPLSIIPHLAPP